MSNEMDSATVEYTNKYVLISKSFYNHQNPFSTNVFHLPYRTEQGEVRPMCKDCSVAGGKGVGKHSIKQTDFTDLRPCKNCIRRKREMLGVSGERIEPRRVPYKIKPVD